MMMRQSQNVRTKGKRSFRDKQVSCTPFKRNFLFGTSPNFIDICFSCYSDCPTECTPEKEEAAQITTHLDLAYFLFLQPSL